MCFSHQTPFHASCLFILSLTSLLIHFHIRFFCNMCFDNFIFSHPLPHWACSCHGIPSQATLLCLCPAFTAQQSCSPFPTFYIESMHTDISSFIYIFSSPFLLFFLFFLFHTLSVWVLHFHHIALSIDLRSLISCVSVSMATSASNIPLYLVISSRILIIHLMTHSPIAMNLHFLLDFLYKS